MTIASELQALANELAAEQQAKVARLERELADLENTKLQKQMELATARVAAQRGLDFRPTLGPDYQCPRCFVVGKEGCALRSIGGEPSYDVFRCGCCNEKFRFLVDT